MISFHALVPCGCDSSAKLPYFCLHVQTKHDISLHHCLGTGQVAMVPALLCLIISCLYLGDTHTFFPVFYRIEIYVLIFQVHHVVTSGDK